MRSRIEFLEPWCAFVPGQGDAFLDELRLEVSTDHPLSGLNLLPLAHWGAADDALFELPDDRIVQVRLTWSEHAEQPPWPRHRFYSNIAEWVEHVMLPAYAEYMS